MNARLDQLGQAIERPPVTVTEGAPPVHPLGRQELLQVTQINPLEFEAGPLAYLGRDADGFLFGDAGGFAATFPWLAAMPLRQARLAVETGLAMLDRADRETGGFREFTSVVPASGVIRRNEARIARRAFRRAGRAPAGPWGFLASIMWDIARVIVPGPFVVFEPGDPSHEQDLNRQRSRFYQTWWRLVMRRLAFADAPRAELTFKRTPRRLVLRPRILGPGPQLDGQLGQLVRVREGARSVRRLFNRGVERGNQQDLATGFPFLAPMLSELSPVDFERGPISFVEGARVDATWPWTAWPWLAALPAEQATLAAETSLAMMPRRRGAEAQAARRVFRSARQSLREVRQARRLVARGGGTGLQRAADMHLYRDLTHVVAHVAAELVSPRAIGVPVSSLRFPSLLPRDVINDARTAFYQRWWRLVMDRLAFADAPTASLTLKATKRGVIIRPAILGQLAGGLDLDRAILGSCFGGSP